ncbi:MAG TPA: hypothetical protein VFA45_06075 [Actinomycetes bacterium]|jgi:hypothetical protein|nr:hypothetical protein [Actinomycetes bacterium]
MNALPSPSATSWLRDVASSSEFAEISRLFNASRYLSRESLRGLPDRNGGWLSEPAIILTLTGGALAKRLARTAPMTSTW